VSIHRAGPVYRHFGKVNEGAVMLIQLHTVIYRRTVKLIIIIYLRTQAGTNGTKNNM